MQQMYINIFKIKIDEQCTPKIFIIQHINNAKNHTAKIQKMHKFHMMSLLFVLAETKKSSRVIHPTPGYSPPRGEESTHM